MNAPLNLKGLSVIAVWIPQTNNKSHSFRIGAASHAAENGYSDA
jgi:hypothetical protein